MKDYYYFLGVNKDSSDEEIKLAYRKLSLKYHPDKNEGDSFFSDRFREIQEAFDTLSNADKRKIYDSNFNQLQYHIKSDQPPRIKSFQANKIRAKKGEEIIITWQTFDADLVKVLPFGLEKSYGERVFKVKEFDSQGKFQILLHATNTYINKTVAAGITITEIKGDFTSDDYKEELEPKFTEPEKKSKPQKINLWFALLWVILIILFFIYKFNK